MKSFQAIISEQGRMIGLLFLFLILAGISKPTHAATYNYTGPSFDIQECEAIYSGWPDVVCYDGNITASITVPDWVVARGFASSTINDFTSWTVTSTPFGTVSSDAGNWIQAYVDFDSNGQIVSWEIDAATSNFEGDNLFIYFNSIWAGSFQHDEAFVAENGYFLSAGAEYGARGTWIRIDGGGDVLADAGKAMGNNNPGGCSTGNPCSVGTGNKYQEVTDYTTAGRNNLSFTRYYNSLASNDDPFATELGPRWRSNYDRYLDIISPTEVTAARADGQVLHFTNTGGVWSSDSDVDARLTNNGATWTLTDRNDTVETYTQLNSGEALLQKITARNGYTQTLDYDPSMQLTTVTDSYGRNLTFTYNGSGQLTQVATPDSLVLSYGYDSSNGALTSVSYNTTPATQQIYSYVNDFDLASITDENGNVFASWTYDAQHRALTSQHANGAELVTISYDTDTQRTVTNALGQQTVYTFTTLQGVPKITGISRTASATVPAATESFTYDSNGYTASMTDWNGRVTNYTNDAHGNPTSITEAAGTAQARTTTITYGGPNGRQPVRIVAPRLTTGFTYDASGNVLTRTETDTSGTGGQARTWAFTYDATGHMLTATDPHGAVTTYTYDGNNIATVTNALGHASQITSYNGSGLPLSMTDPNSVVTSFAYDLRNRPVSRTIHDSGDDAATEFAYDAAGNLTAITLPDDTQLLYTYDAAHRVTEVRNSAGEKISYTLDAVGNITQQQTSGTTITHSQSAIFDSLGRMLHQIGAYNETTAFTYDANGNPLTITDALNNPASQSFDALNRVIQSVDRLNGTASYTYDTQDNLTSVTDPRGLVTTYTYNGFGEVVSQASPDSGTTTFVLDVAGNRTQETDARGVVTNRTFDQLNRVTAETYPAASKDNVTYTYDQGVFGIGRLASFKDKSGSTAFTYDARGNILTDTRKIVGKSYEIFYAYDLADRIVGITYPDGRAVKYTRDAVGRIASVSLQTQGKDDHHWRKSCRDRRHGSGDKALVSNVTYMPFGPLSAMTFGNGITSSLSYDLNYRMTGISSVVQNLGMGYNANDNVISIADQLDATRSQSFTYDANERLLTALGAYGGRGYGYDAVSNRTGESFSIGTETGTSAYAYPANANRLASISGDETRAFTYDAAGNLLTDTAANDDDRKDYDGNRGYRGHGHKYGHTKDKHGNKPKDIESRAFAYDSRNRNTSITIHDGRGRDAKTFRYAYNAMGQRVAKDGFHFIYDLAGNLIAEKGNGGWKDYIYVGSMPVAMIENNQVYYIHTDHLGAPQKVTDTRQKIVWDRVAEPFGETMQILGPVNDNRGRNAQPTRGSTTVTLNLRFPGQYHDEETGLDYNYFRTYDPTVGRYTQSDPIGLAGGLNTFGYAVQNPVNFVDPNGQFIFLLVFGPSLGAVIGDALFLGSIIYGSQDMPNANQCAVALNNTAPSILNNNKAPENANNPDGPKAPGKPGEEQGFKDPKGGENWVPNPNGTGYGWQDDKGNVWVPTGPGGTPGTGTTGPAHGGPHWDVQDPKTGGADNVYPGGFRR